MHSPNNRKENYQDRLRQLSASQKRALAKRLSINNDKGGEKLIACVTLSQSQVLDSNILKTFAQSTLPEHFVPQIIKQVEQLPRTHVGKIERKEAQSYAWKLLNNDTISANTNTEDEDDGFDIFGDDAFGNSAYVAPTNETETLLAKIWSEVLGSGDISIHDEFLEVGGDSLLSIRILARINKAGLSIATEDFFEYPTIAGQAKAIRQVSEKRYEQGSTTGQFALIPIQQWLFERIQIDCHHWNQSIVLAVDEKLDFVSLERAFQKVLLHHDALRIAFNHKTDGNWQQAYMPLQSTLNIQRVNCTGGNEQTQDELCVQHVSAINRSMNLADGNLIQLAFFESPTGEANRLAIVVHHLIIDAESWRILLEDIQSCWFEFALGNTPVLAQKTSSFKHWSQKLAEYSQSEILVSEQAYWLQQASQTTIPLDYVASLQENTVESTSVVSASLSQEHTAILVGEIPSKLKVSVKDALITALVTVVQHWHNEEEVLIDIEGHGREDLFENVDISRTVGWFTTVFPVLFTIPPNETLQDNLSKVSRTLSAIPKNGIGHGLLRNNEAGSELKQQAYSEICFNYLGQIDTSTNSGDLDEPTSFTQLSTNIGQPRSADGLRAFKIEVNARIENNQLSVDWSFSKKLHKAETIERLVNEFIQTLTQLLALDGPNISSEDDDDLFDLVDLEDDELDAINKALSGDN